MTLIVTKGLIVMHLDHNMFRRGTGFISSGEKSLEIVIADAKLLAKVVLHRDGKRQEELDHNDLFIIIIMILLRLDTVVVVVVFGGVRGRFHVDQSRGRDVIGFVGGTVGGRGAIAVAAGRARLAVLAGLEQRAVAAAKQMMTVKDCPSLWYCASWMLGLLHTHPDHS